MLHIIPWRFGSDHVPLFSWVMAVGEPAVHLPGCNNHGPWLMSPLKDRAVGSFQMAIFLAYKWGAQWLTIDQLG